MKTTNVRRMQRESEMRSAVSSCVKERERSSWERSRNRAVAMLPAPTTIKLYHTFLGQMVNNYLSQFESATILHPEFLSH